MLDSGLDAMEGMMTLTTYDNITQGDDEWLALRCGTLTASDMGKLVTAKTLKVAANDHSRALVAEKTAQRITGEIEPQWISDDMLKGIELEPVAREYYAKLEPDVYEVGFLKRDFDGFSIGASPDGLVGDVGGWEVKCPRQKAHIQTVLSGEIPEQYIMQVQTCLLVSGREWWDFSSCYPGLVMPVIRVEPDKRIHEVILAASAQFEETVAAGVEKWYERVKDSGLRMIETQKIVEQEMVI